VATALVKWKLPVKYCTSLPANYLSDEICEELQKKQIDISAIHFSGTRIGTYYLPQGTDLKNAGVIYDRAGSSFSELKPGMIDWHQVLKDCCWFHFSAISPALNENIAMVCNEALKVASELGLTISVDLNYRSKLWKYGKQPIDIMPLLVQYCDIVMGNIWSAHELLGISLDDKIHEKKNKTGYLEHARKTATTIMKKFPVCKYAAQTFRFQDENKVLYYATLDNELEQFVSPEFSAESVVDKVGSGDCFMAGLIYGLFNKQESQPVIDFAAAAAFGKLQETGDSTNQSVGDVHTILKTGIPTKPRTV
jgi:2-dehydro-3-deoxygluconokinase